MELVRKGNWYFLKGLCVRREKVNLGEDLTRRGNKFESCVCHHQKGEN